MLSQREQLVDLIHTLNSSRRGSGLGRVQAEVKLVFVEVLEHLLKGDGVMGHEGKDVLLCGALVEFGFFDLHCHDCGGAEDGFVGVEGWAVGTTFWAKLDDKDCGGEVAVHLLALESGTSMC